MRLWEKRHKHKERLLEKPKLANHAYEDGERIGWNIAMLLEIELRVGIGNI